MMKKEILKTMGSPSVIIAGSIGFAAICLWNLLRGGRKKKRLNARAHQEE